MKEVWDYVQKFSEFTNFQLRVKGFFDGKLIPIPFNFDSMYQTFPSVFAQRLEETLLTYYPYNSKISIGQLREKAKQERNVDLSFLADYIFEKIFKNYTMKQRGIEEKDFNPEVIARVPVIISRDDRYFPHHPYQGMPAQGYTQMFKKMLQSPKIKLLVNTDYKTMIKDVKYDQLCITAPIDEYFDYKYGKLEYRKTLFHLETHHCQSFQDNIVVNYPNDYEWTRITEMKKFYPQSKTYHIDQTVICKEFP
jgi:UDP-galactopyranose mutase